MRHRHTRRQALARMTGALLLGAPLGCATASLRERPLRTSIQSMRAQGARARLHQRVHTHEGQLPERALGTARARLVGVMSGEGEREPQPRHLVGDFTADTVTLIRRHPRTCFEVTLQTERSYDLPLEQLEPTCEIDGQRLEATILEERAHPTLIWYQRPYYFLWGVDRSFDVITRHGELCCAQPTRQLVELRLTNPLLAITPGQPWRLWMRWALTPG